MDEDLSSLVEALHDFFDSSYLLKINELVAHYPARKSFNVDYHDLEKYDYDIADRLIKKPDEVIAAAKEAVKKFNILVPGHGIFSPNVRFFNVPDNNLLIENISSKNLGELISVKGVVNRRADVMHKMQIAVYKCQVCDSIYKTVVERGFVPLKRCESCKRIALKQMDEESKFVDLQKAEVQELLERVRGGTPAARIELWIEDDAVNSIVPGDNVEIVGVLRLKPPIAQKGKQEMIYGRYLEVNSIRSLRRDFEEIEISKDEEKQIADFSKDVQLVKKITESIAPSIYGHTEVKYAIALQIFGGTKGKTTKGLPIRDDIHIILIGDPGIAKSRFLQSVMEIAPKKIYVSGKSVSGVGLTVAVEKDELSGGGWTLKAGALVLASGGLAAIDEFDKIEDEDRAALHEVMESQTVSIAKAGLVATFKTKTAILAAANPKFGRFNQNKNLVEQFDIPPSLMSRFDLIFPILDILDIEKDSKLAEYILNAHQQASLSETEKTLDNELIDKDFLRKYISYSRRHIFPKLTRDAMDKLKEYYLDLRKRGKDSGTVPITPRYLEGLIRLSEANAKMRLSQSVESSDAEVAIHLMNYIMEKVMIDKETGLADVSIIETGKTKSQLERSEIIFDIIKELCRKFDVAEESQIINEAKNYNIEEHHIMRILGELVKNGQVYKPAHGKYHPA